ncbi:hypothetical protein [Nocardiopsis synnemataformans]|uniref:hypothetical protein n=1 Tax=Nocardiopsis synnemataformans TaxID=61305 RepID=UPI003EB85382
MENPLIRYAALARHETDIDPRTEVEAHWGGDPEQLIDAWETDRARLMAKLDRERHRSARYREDRDNAWWKLENE